jgi:YVTN family beta-propeller protein
MRKMCQFFLKGWNLARLPDSKFPIQSITCLLLIIFIRLSIHCHADLAYVAIRDGSGAQSVIVIDTETNTIVDTITDPSFNSPTDVAITPNGQFVLVSNIMGFSISVISTATNSVIHVIMFTSEPGPIAITPDGRFAYVSSAAGNEVFVIRMSDFSIYDIIAGVDNPGAIAITPNGESVYVDNDGISVTVISTATNTVVHTIMGNSADSIAFSLDGTFAYFAADAGSVSIFQTSDYSFVTNIPIASILVQTQPNANAVYTAFTHTGFVDFSVGVINTINNTLASSAILTPSGQFGVQMAFTPDGQFLYIPLFNANEVLAVDANTLTVVATIPVGVNPAGIAILGVGQPAPVLQGKQLKNDFGLQYELFNLLQWQPSTTLNISGYHIYRDNRLIATVGPNTFQYRDHDIEKHTIHHYSVTSFSSTGNGTNESKAATISIP